MLARSAFALNCAGEFNAWASAVSLNPNVRENVPLPPDLQGLLDKSRRYPLWVNNQDAEQYAHLRRFHPEIDAETISTFVTAIQCHSPSNSMHYEIDPDARLSSDVERALPHAFFIPRHRKSVRRAEVVLPDIHQANLRAPLDRLLSHVWLSDDLYDNRFVHILECSLKMPDAKVHHTFDTSIASAMTFICDRDPSHTLDFSNDLKEYLTCTSQVPHCLAVAHWITQYTRSKEQTEPDVERQTIFGMVSGIWQRRSLGFSQHWVFGMMHFGDNIHVLAGRWEDDQPSPYDNPVSTINSVALDPSFNEHPTSSTPYLQTENAGKKGAMISQRGSSEISATQMSLENSPSTGNSRSGSEDDERTPAKEGLRGTSKGHRGQIVIYRVAKYTTASALSMLELYLFLRASRQLGLTYRSEIFNEGVW
ncbi:hypothetical protein FRC08_009987 [Ceratobasidium sp. 394]|nr:hypothetical protein FRC08_009987 [Ceratobasidium sp. 394]